MNVSLQKTTINTLLQLLLLFTLLISATAHAAKITVTTSRNPVALDDSFHIIYEADSNIDGDPDFTPVYKDFDVLSSSQSTNMRSINGNWSMKKSWDLAVIAKDIGKFTIPPIHFGNDLSPSIQISVTSSTSQNSLSADGSATVPANIFLETTVDKKSAWVQSQFIYTVRLLRTVSISSASLTEPETTDPDAIVSLIAEDQYQTTRNGVRYEVIERRYAIFPQKSGKLTINPVTFEGRINDTQPRSIFDQLRMSGQLKRLRSKAVRIDVKPAPANINLQDWLPASKVQLFEEWSNDMDNLKTGEPVTRTITIAADGLTGVQLPDIKFTEVDGLKQYPDKAVTENRQGTNGVTGIKQIKVALIPTHAGDYTLPEIKLNWWNTKTNRKESVSIPPTMIKATGKPQTSAPPSPALPAQNQTTQTSQAATADKTSTSAIPAEQQEPYWKWLALLFATAWLITLVLLLKKPKQAEPQSKVTVVPSGITLKAAAAEVEKQARNNSAGKTRTALITWAQLFYNDHDITNLGQISGYCSDRLDQQIRDLNQSLYSPDKATWNGAELLTAFKGEQLIADSFDHQQHSALKPLYGG